MGASWHSILRIVGTFNIPQSEMSCVLGISDQRPYHPLWTLQKLTIGSLSSWLEASGQHNASGPSWLEFISEASWRLNKWWGPCVQQETNQTSMKHDGSVYLNSRSLTFKFWESVGMVQHLSGWPFVELVTLCIAVLYWTTQ